MQGPAIFSVKKNMTKFNFPCMQHLVSTRHPLVAKLQSFSSQIKQFIPLLKVFKTVSRAQKDLFMV
jgi:hypothetical protein